MIGLSLLLVSLCPVPPAALAQAASAGSHAASGTVWLDDVRLERLA